MKVREIEIEHDEIWCTERCGFQPFFGVFCLLNSEAVKLEAGAKKAPYLRLIIDHEYDVYRFTHRLEPPGWCLQPKLRAERLMPSFQVPRLGWRHRWCRHSP